MHFWAGLSSVEKLKSYFTLVAKEMQMRGVDLLTKLRWLQFVALVVSCGLVGESGGNLFFGIAVGVTFLSPISLMGFVAPIGSWEIWL